MSDGKGPVGSIAKDVGEALVDPLVDEAGEVAQDLAQAFGGSATQSNKNPQDDQKNKQSFSSNKTQIEEQKKKDQAKLRNVQNFIEQMKADEQRAQMERKQKEEQEKNEEALEQQEKAQIKQFKIVQKRETLNQDLVNKQRWVERKRGGG